MQYPAGMFFNPDTARNEMHNFWEVLLSPVSVNKFLHTISSGYVLAALFVVGISAWYLLKGRNVLLAKRSIIVASVFGLITSVFLALTGDGSAYQVAQKQPMKLAAMEGLYEGKEGAPLIVIGALTPGKQYNDNKDPYLFRIQIPKLLSFLGYRSGDAFVPGVKDIVEGGYTYTDKDGNQKVALSAEQKIERGRIAIQALADYKNAKELGDTTAMAYHRKLLDANFEYFGYGYLNDPKSIIPNVPLTFYSFHIMVGLGFLFIAFFILILT